MYFRLFLFATSWYTAIARSRRSSQRGAPVSEPRALPTLPNVTLGPVEVVVDWPTQHCNCSESPSCTDPHDPDYPDTPPRIFVDAARTAHLWATDAESRQSLLVDGSAAWLHNCSVHAPSQFDCRVSGFNFQTWIHSPFIFDDGLEGLSLVHMEYHGWQCAGNSSCVNSNGGDCADEAVQLWQTRDGGWSWSPVGGSPGIPGNVVAQSPYTYEYSRDHWNHSELGFGDPTTIVLDPATQTLNVLISTSNPAIGDNNYTGLQQRGQCLFRVPVADYLNVSAWRAWDGSDFTAVLSVNPYFTPITNYSAHVCKPVNASMILVNVGWSTLFRSWIASGFGSYRYPNGTDIPCCGAFLYSVSTDLINWDTPQLLRENIQEGSSKDAMWEYDPTFLDPTAFSTHAERNWHAIIGDAPYLFFWQADGIDPGRSVKRQSVSFS
jgi:hypothetical protein